ncbi:MAG: sigma-70 family RNA polymerase sigma factor [Ruminococcaceae bacterium]|nr:sigma-70 family RNA polymerase sigma factor [Oscillospiraceae bacterium]
MKERLKKKEGVNKVAVFNDKTKKEELSEDAKLVFAAIDGDNDAFGKLLEKYSSFVYRTVFYDIKSKEDAEDISQEVFIKAYKALANFRSDSEFSTWIYRICKNTIYDYIRKSSREKSIPLSEMSSGDENDRIYDIPDDSGKYDPEKTYISKETADIVNDAISSLSEEHKSIILMRDIEGYSYGEIADILSIEEGTVKSRLSRARNSLKKKLENLKML